MSTYLPTEAADKLCPQMLPFIGDDIDDPPRQFFCRGTQCMAWRWAPRTGLDIRLRGYCGLAGKPETDIAP